MSRPVQQVSERPATCWTEVEMHSITTPGLHAFPLILKSQAVSA
jgi:hypothetical protein